MTLMLLSYPAPVRIIDHEGEVRIVGRDGDRPRSLSITSLVWDVLSGPAVAAFVVALLWHSLGRYCYRHSASNRLLSDDRRDAHVLFVFVNNSPEEISITLNPSVLNLADLLGLWYTLVQGYRRGKPPIPDPREPLHG